MGHRSEAAPALQDPGNWQDLEAVSKAGASLATERRLQHLLARHAAPEAEAEDSVSTGLRRHALRAPRQGE